MQQRAGGTPIIVMAVAERVNEGVPHQGRRRQSAKEHGQWTQVPAQRVRPFARAMAAGRGPAPKQEPYRYPAATP